MATNTCVSVITYQSRDDSLIAPFCQMREDFANYMHSQGKTEAMPNYFNSESDPAVSYRSWVDHAAAQEFLDFVIEAAPIYHITLVSTGIQDL